MLNAVAKKTTENHQRQHLGVAQTLQRKRQGHLRVAGKEKGESKSIAQLQVYQLIADSSQRVAQLKSYQDLANRSNRYPVQMKVNHTGLPDQLKSGIESLSGHAMDDVTVHYNSSKPAQLNAHAYAQGTDIHLASGQEKHLPHEAWHVVQQKQGRVQPTKQLKTKVNINDDIGLEKEADIMGEKALSITNPIQKEQKQEVPNASNQVIQRAVGFELQTNWGIEPDPYGAVEGSASFMGSELAKTLGLRADEASTLGFWAGRATRIPTALLGRVSGGLGGWLSWGLDRIGAGRISERAERFSDTAHHASLRAVPKGFALINGTGWSMSSDEGEMEFVTNPFAETDIAGLRRTMQEILTFNRRLLAMNTRSYIPINWFDGVTALGNLAAIVPNGTAIAAVPQMTAGIDMTQFHAMLTAMTTHAPTRGATTRGRAGLLNAVRTNLPGALAHYSDTYKTVVTLMASYVAQSALLPGAIEKDIATIMGRTNMGLLFQQSREYKLKKSGHYDKSWAKMKQDLLSFVLNTATGAVGGHHGLVTAINGGMRLFPGDDPTRRNGPTVRAWSDGVVMGQDATVAGWSRISSRSMGGMKKLEAVGPTGAPGLIAEFRDLPTNVPYGQWETMAVDLMTWMARVNDPAAVNKHHP